MAEQIQINRAPILTLWAAAVAERLGFDRDAALTLGKCLAGLNAQAKGRSLGIFAPKKPEKGPPKKAARGEEFWVELCGRALPAKNTDAGIRAVVGDKPIDSAGVQRYLEGKFGDDLPAVERALADLAGAFKPEELAERAFALYEQFRPSIPPGVRGWGAKGVLDLAVVRSLGR
jgi:hypothetical protein